MSAAFANDGSEKRFRAIGAWFRVGTLAAMVGAVAGCSTIEHGATDDVYVLSEPPGAKVTVSFGDDTCVTPCHLAVTRQTEFSVVVEKDGFETATVPVTTRSVAPPGATSQDLNADYLGRLADVRDGANLVHDPNPVSVTLKKSG